MYYLSLMQSYDGGRLVDTDIFFDYVELVEEPLKALLITNKYVDQTAVTVMLYMHVIISIFIWLCIL